MTQREQLTAVLKGDVPDRTPFSIYSYFAGREEKDLFADQWMTLYDQGLSLCHHVATVQLVEHGVEDSFEERREGGHVWQIYRKQTPVGTLERKVRDGWRVGQWIKEPRDYDILRWIVEHTEVVPCYEAFAQGEDLIGDLGVCVIGVSRTPAMNINVVWAGTERFCMDVALELPELLELHEAMKKLFIAETKLIAAGPGSFVKWNENLTISMLGPQRYRELLVPIYDECTPIMEAGGKRVMVHYDGALRCIAEDIARSPLHIIQSLTEPPEGDMMYDECRAAWPDKVFWSHLNLDLYNRPHEELRQAVIDKRNRAGKRGLAFEISEDLPANWRETLPVVLGALAELD
jgi:hypothetical protein